MFCAAQRVGSTASYTLDTPVRTHLCHHAPAARCYSPACASPPASRPWRMSRSTTARPWCANASPSPHPSPEPGPAHHRRRTPEPLSPPGPTCPDGQLLRRTPTHQRRRAATLLMQSTAALGNETSQELGGSCANTRDSDIVSPAPSGRGCPIRSVRAAAVQQVEGNCETCSPVRRQFRRRAIRRSRVGLGGRSADVRRRPYARRGTVRVLRGRTRGSRVAQRRGGVARQCLPVSLAPRSTRRGN